MAGQSRQGYDFDDTTSIVIQGCIAVHNAVKAGSRELTYQRALEIEFGYLGLEFEREVEIPVYYRGIEIDKRRVDFIVAGCVLEIKAKDCLEPRDLIQTVWYLKQTNYRVGLLINFGGERIEIKRFVNSKGQADHPTGQ